MATLPRNSDLADRFDQLADLSEILGEQSFRVGAYRRAATRIRDTATSVAELALEGKAKELPDIGKTIEAKIVEVAETGDMAALAKRRAEVPGEVASFMRLPGLGPKTAARIWRELGVTTLPELKAAAEGERLRALSGMGAATEAKILKALAEGQGAAEPTRGLLGKGLPVVREVVELLREHPAAVEVSEAGSTRRRRETFRDLDVIATATDAAALTEYFIGLPWVLDVVAHGDTKATVITNQGLRLDLRVVPPESYGDLLQHFTGSKEHNVALREQAQRDGLSVSEYGVTVVETGEVRTFADEASLYAFLGYSVIPPELRENGGELEAARAGALPRLVELDELRGEMHCHSTWSADGKATIEEMAREAQARGYEFLCLTDHSHYLREGRIEEQWREIAKVNQRLDGFRVLRGVEANITAKGDVDVPAETLAELDWVVASLHTSLDRNPTERVLAAIENPDIDCIGHLSGRRLSRRAGADLDIELVIERAVATRTALEINSQPDRLDLRDSHARLAGAAGVAIPVNTDAHSTAAFSYAELGIGQARRAWLTKEHVLNTRTWAEIEAMRG